MGGKDGCFESLGCEWMEMYFLLDDEDFGESAGLIDRGRDRKERGRKGWSFGGGRLSKDSGNLKRAVFATSLSVLGLYCLPRGYSSPHGYESMLEVRNFFWPRRDLLLRAPTVVDVRLLMLLCVWNSGDGIVSLLLHDYILFARGFQAVLAAFSKPKSEIIQPLGRGRLLAGLLLS